MLQSKLVANTDGSSGVANLAGCQEPVQSHPSALQGRLSLLRSCADIAVIPWPYLIRHGLLRFRMSGRLPLFSLWIDTVKSIFSKSLNCFSSTTASAVFFAVFSSGFLPATPDSSRKFSPACERASSPEILFCFAASLVPSVKASETRFWKLAIVLSLPGRATVGVDLISAAAAFVAAMLSSTNFFRLSGTGSSAILLSISL